MMEDLAPAEQGDQLKGVTVGQARLAVIEAAKLHASHWGDDGLDALPWVSNAQGRAAERANPETVGMLWQGFKQRYGARLQPHWTEAGERLIEGFTGIWLSTTGRAGLTHNDFGRTT